MIRLAFERNGRAVKKVERTRVHTITNKDHEKFTDAINQFTDSLIDVTKGEATIIDIKLSTTTSFGRLVYTALIVYEIEENITIEDKKTP